VTGDRLSVKTICKLTGVNEHTLRAWERRYSVVEPDRLDNGRRVYSLDDLEKLKLINKLLKSGFLIGHIASYQQHELVMLLQETVHKIDSNGSTRSVQQVILGIENALVEFDTYKLQGLLEKARIEYGIRELLYQVMQPLIDGVTEKLNSGQLHAGHEQVFAGLVKYQLLQILNLLNVPGRIEGFRSRSFTALTTHGVESELQVLMAAVICAINEFPVFFLGGGLPAVALADTMMAVSSNTLIIASSPINQQNNEMLSEYIRAVAERASGRLEIWVRGAAGSIQPASFSLPVRVMTSLTDLDNNLLNVR